MARTYFTRRQNSDQIEGPFSLSQVQERVNQKELGSNDEISQSEQGPWITIKEYSRKNSDRSAVKPASPPEVAVSPELPRVEVPPLATAATEAASTEFPARKSDKLQKSRWLVTCLLIFAFGIGLGFATAAVIQKAPHAEQASSQSVITENAAVAQGRQNPAATGPATLSHIPGSSFVEQLMTHSLTNATPTDLIEQLRTEKDDMKFLLLIDQIRYDIQRLQRAAASARSTEQTRSLAEPLENLASTREVLVWICEGLQYGGFIPWPAAEDNASVKPRTAREQLAIIIDVDHPTGKKQSRTSFAAALMKNLPQEEIPIMNRGVFQYVDAGQYARYLEKKEELALKDVSRFFETQQ